MISRISTVMLWVGVYNIHENFLINIFGEGEDLSFDLLYLGVFVFAVSIQCLADVVFLPTTARRPYISFNDLSLPAKFATVLRALLGQVYGCILSFVGSDFIFSRNHIIETAADCDANESNRVRKCVYIIMGAIMMMVTDTFKPYAEVFTDFKNIPPTRRNLYLMKSWLPLPLVSCMDGTWFAYHTSSTDSAPNERTTLAASSSPSTVLSAGGTFDFPMLDDQGPRSEDAGKDTEDHELNIADERTRVLGPLGKERWVLFGQCFVGSIGFYMQWSSFEAYLIIFGPGSVCIPGSPRGIELSGQTCVVGTSIGFLLMVFAGTLIPPMPQ